METRLKEAEQQKVSLKKQIENFMNDEHTASGEAARVSFLLPFSNSDPTCSSRRD